MPNQADWPAILENVSDYVIITDPGFRVVYSNSAIRRVLGCSPGSALSVEAVCGAEGARFLRESALPHAEEHGQWRGKSRLLCPDGRAADVDLALVILRGEGSERTGIALIARDISELEAAQKQADEALRQASAAALAKTQFLANISHEILTPMNAIIGMTKIAMKIDDIPKIRSCLSKVESSSQHLLAIINDLLDVSRTETGSFELFYEEFDLEETLRDIISAISHKAKEHRHEFHVKIGKNIPCGYRGDTVRLTQVIINLLSNAVKFTPPGGRIGLYAEAGERRGNEITLLFRVTDNGIGISAEQLSGLFTLFEQGDKGDTKRYAGTGLGLAISQRIAKLMNGAITVKSEVGRGSEFSFSAVLETLPDGRTLRPLVSPEPCSPKENDPAEDASRSLPLPRTNAPCEAAALDNHQKLQPKEEVSPMSREDLAGIDVSRGLRIVNRNVKLYARLLKSFLENTLYQEFVAAVAEKDSQNSAAKAHALKGVVANLALTEISDIIVPLEEGLKKGTISLPSEAELQRLADAHARTTSAIEKILADPEILEDYAQGT